MTNIPRPVKFLPLFFILLFTTTSFVTAKQKISGYYITRENDTIRCEISVGFDLFGDVRLEPLQFKVECIDSTGAKHKFKPGEIKGFGIENDTLHYYFVTLSNIFNAERPFHTDTLIFANIIVNGYVKLYKIATERPGGSMPGPNGTWTPTGGGTQHTYYLKKGMAEPDAVRQLFFRKDITGILNDYLPLVTKIDSKEYGYKDIEKIVREYNAWKR